MIVILKLWKKAYKKKHHKKNNKGTLSFEYNKTDQLDRLVMVIKANY